MSAVSNELCYRVAWVHERAMAECLGLEKMLPVPGREKFVLDIPFHRTDPDILSGLRLIYEEAVGRSATANWPG